MMMMMMTLPRLREKALLSRQQRSRMQMTSISSGGGGMIAVLLAVVIAVFLQVALAQDQNNNTDSSAKVEETSGGNLNKSLPVEVKTVEEGADLMGDILKEAKSSIELLRKFDKDGDERLDKEEFGELCSALFRNGSQSYPLGSDEALETLFKIFDWNGNGFICADEFESCYTDWIRRIVNPVSVLVVVDVQNDFISGSLALKKAPAGQDGAEVVPIINKMLETIPFQKVFYIHDWHPSNHISFIDNVDKWPIHNSSRIQDPKQANILDTVTFQGEDGSPVEQRLWPAHCVQNTEGAELHPDLNIISNSKDVYKGLQPQVDSYSAFLDNDKKSMTPLKTFIEAEGAKDVYVCGLAYEICVGLTAVDSLNLGFRTVLVEDAARAVDLAGVKPIQDKIRELDGLLTDSDKVKDMVLGKDRRPEMGLNLAKSLHKEKMMAISQNSDVKS